jgi:hypothetical protein
MTLSEIVGGNPFKNIRRLDISQEEYFAIDAYSSTDLRTLYIDRGQPYGMAQKKAGAYVESDAMLLGSVIDCLITEPSEFDNRFAVWTRDLNLPSTTLQQAVCDEIIAGVDPAEAHAKHYKNSGEKAVAQFLEQFEPYCTNYRLINLGEEKKRRMLSADIAERAREAVSAARQHTQFVEIVRSSEKQVAFVAEAFGVQWKGLLDFYRPGYVTDLKTTSNFLGIRSSFNQRAYAIQMRLYSWLAEAHTAEHFYIETQEPYRTKLTDEPTQLMNEEFWTEKTLEMMQRIAHHHNTGDWTRTMEYYTNGGYERL